MKKNQKNLPPPPPPRSTGRKKKPVVGRVKSCFYTTLKLDFKGLYPLLLLSSEFIMFYHVKKQLPI